MLLFFQAEDGIRDLTVTGVQTCALPIFDLCEETIEIAKVRHVSLYGGDSAPDLLDRRSQLRITAPRDEDVGAFVHKLLRRRKANTASATGDEADLSFKLTHGFPLGSGGGPTPR